MKLFTTTLFFIVLSTFTTQAANRYWISDVDGVWNNTANWSTTAGGAGGASVPSTIDHVYLSNISGSGNITLDIDVSINGFITTTFTGTLDFNGHQFNPSFSNNAYVKIDDITISNSSGNVNLTYNTVAPTRIYLATINVPTVVTSQRLQLINSTFNQNVTIYQTSVTNMSSSGGCTFNGTFRFYHYGNYDYKLGTSAKMTYNGRAFFYNYSSRKILISYSGQGSDFNHNIYVSNSNATLGSGIYFGALNAPSKLASGRRIYIGFAGFSNGQLNLRNFTQLGTTSQTLSFTGTASLYMKSTTWFGSVNFTAHRQFLISNNFQNVSSFNQTGSQTAISSGGNNFWGNCALTNSGTGSFRLGTSNPDIFHANLTLNQTGSGVLVVAEKSIGNSVTGNLTISHQGTGVSKITLASDSSSSLNITGNTTITDLSTGTDNQTILGLNGDVTLTGNLTITNNSNSTASKIILGNDVKSSVSIDGVTTVTNAGTGALSQIILGEKGDLTFNNTLNLINNSTATDSKIILNNQVKSSNLYRNIVFTCTNAASEGFFIGLNYGRGVIKNTYTLSSSNTGFTHGLLHFRNFVQQGATTQNLTLTQNASLLLDRSYWYGSLNFKSPSISIKQNRFYNPTASLEQTGANNTFSFGDNYAYKYLTIKNSGSGSFILGQTVRDRFTKGLRLWNTGAGKIYLGYSTPGNSISQTLDIDNVGTTNNSNIYVGYTSTSQATITSAIINNSKGNTYLGYAGDITIADLTINNNTTTDASTFIAHNQTSTVSISSPSSINNSGTGTSSKIICGNDGDVTFNGTLNINNSASATTSEIIFGNSSNSSMSFNNDILVTSTGSSNSKIIFGKNNAVATLAINKTVTTPSFTNGKLRFDHFTQLGTLSQVLNMSSGFLELDNSTWNGNVNFIARSIILKENTFKLISILQKNTSSSNCYGGNTFFGPVTIRSTGNGQFSFGNTAADLFKSNLTLDATKGTITIAAGSSVNQVMGNIIATTTNYYSYINFASNTNSSLIVDGYVSLRNYATFTLSSPSYFTSNITLGVSGDVTLNNNLDITISGGNVKSKITVAQGSTSQVSIAGNTSVYNSGYSAQKNINLGYNGDITFNGALSITNASYAIESGIYLNHNSTSQNSYNQNITLKSTKSNCDGIFFGKNGGSGTLANTKTVTIPSPSSTNFIGGTLLFKNFTQVGNAPQNLTLGGTSSLLKSESSLWQYDVNFKAPQIELKQSTFDSPAIIEKTGAIDNLCYGGNTFRDVTIKNSGSGIFALGDVSPDTYTDDVTLSNSGSSDLILANNTSLNELWGNLTAYNSSSANNSRIILGNTANSAMLIEGNMTLSNQSAGTTKEIYCGYSGDVECRGSTQFINNSTAANSFIHVAYNSGSLFRSVQSSSLISANVASDGITFGLNGGVSVLEANVHILGAFFGLLHLENVNQIATNSITLSLTNDPNSRCVLKNTRWYSNSLILNSPNLTSSNSIFTNNVIFVKLSTGGSSYSPGGNTFNGITKFYNFSNNLFVLANTNGNDYNRTVYYYKNGSGSIHADVAQVSTYAKNIIVYSSTPINLGQGTGGVKFDGNTAQGIVNTFAGNPSISFGKLITQNSTNNITINSPITVTQSLELNQGNIITSPTALLTITDNATVTAVSNDAYIDGPVAKLGNDAFTFPVGNNGIYASISVSAPANTTDKFTASYHNSSPTTDGFNTASISNGVDYMSNTEYWKLDRAAGTDNVEVTLNWDNTRSGQIGAGTLCEARVVQWDGSKWTNQGNGNATGDATSGTVTTGVSRDCATTTPLTNWTNGYPLALASDSNYITWDGTVFEGGSGTSGAPGASDHSRNLKVFGANATLAENAHVKNVVITGTGNITIPDGMVATVDGDIRNNGQITVKNGGSLIQTKLGTSNNTGTGNYTVKVTGNNSPSTYNIWSSPVQSAAITSVFTAANPCDIYAFDAPTQSWKYDYVGNSIITCAGNTFAIDPSYVFSGADGNMDIARGYFAPGSTVNTRNFDGKINNGDISYPITTTTLGNNPRWDNDDWNLLGNPYPSAITMASFWIQNASLISGALYFWDEGDAGSGYHQYNDYAYWNMAGSLNSGNSSRIPNGNIAPGQGFWFYASTSGNAIFRNNMRTENAGVFFKSNPTENHNAWFSFKTPSGLENNILVGYNTDATDAYDSKYDANKTVGNTSVRMASLMNNDEYAIQSFAPLMIGSKKVIPLVVFTDSTGSHTFEMYRTENIPSNFKIYLKDLLLGLTTDLTLTEYTVSLNGNQEYLNRFELVFVNDITNSGGGLGTKGGNGGNDSTVTGISNFSNSNFVLTQTETELIISNKNGFSGTIQIFDVTGKLIWKSTKIENSVSKNIEWSSWSKGSYFVTITNPQEKVFSKQIIKIN